jgi:hypothetical protein
MPMKRGFLSLLATPAGLQELAQIKALQRHRGAQARFEPQRLFSPVAHIRRARIDMLRNMIAKARNRL